MKRFFSFCRKPRSTAVSTPRFSLAARFARCSRGIAAAEFAMVTPLLALLTLGMTDINFAMKRALNGTMGSDAAMRYALAYPADTTGIQAAFYAASGFKADTATLTIDTQCACVGQKTTWQACTTPCPTGTYLRSFVRVNAQYQYEPLFNYPLLPSSLALTSGAISQQL